MKLPCCLSLWINYSGVSVINLRKILCCFFFGDAKFLVLTQKRTPVKPHRFESRDPTRKQKIVLREKSPGKAEAKWYSGGSFKPIGSMYGILTYIWWIFKVNVGAYTIHGSYGKDFFQFSPRMFGEDDSHFDLHLFFKSVSWNHQLRITTSWFWAIGANLVDPEVVNWPWPHACGSMSWNNVTQVLGMGNPGQKGKPKEKPESMSGWIR